MVAKRERLSRGTIFTVLILIAALLISNKETIPVFFSDLRNGYISPTQPATSLNTYTNSVVKFSLKYPSNYKIYEVNLSGTIDQDSSSTSSYPSALWLLGQFPNDAKYGQVGICTRERNYQKEGCYYGMSIFYGIPEIDGKGGVCHGGEYQTVKVSDQEAEACMLKTGFNISYPRHPQGVSELSISGRYGDGFNEWVAKQMIESIEFINK